MKYYTQFSYPASFQGTELQANRILRAYKELKNRIERDGYEYNILNKVDCNCLCDIKTKEINTMMTYETIRRLH